MVKELTVASLTAAIPDEDAAYTWFESIRWPTGPVCPHCGTINHAYHLKPKNGGRKTRTGSVSQRKVWKCGSCRKQFTVTVGTCMERSRIPLRKWAIAFHLFSAAKNGMSSHELGRQLDITHESAWFMSQRIRHALSPAIAQRQLEGVVEVDETYIGGKSKGKRGRGAANKTPVVTLVERKGESRTQVMKTVNAKNMRQALRENVHPESEIMTDEFVVYPAAAGGWRHETVQHSKGEYSRGSVHTNTVEGFFSQFKRSLDGTHHHVSEKHLHRYASEFDFRYNTRTEKDGERTVQAIKKTAGKRLMYQETTR